MPSLSRTSHRLLGTVGNKPYATQQDHHDPLPTPPASNSAASSASKTAEEEDIYGSPVSTDDEEPAPKATSTGRANAKSSTIGVDDERPKRPLFIVPKNAQPRRRDRIHTASERAALRQPTSDARTSDVKSRPQTSGFRHARNVETKSEQASPSAFKLPGSRDSPGTTGSKRSSDDDPSASEDDKPIFSSQGSFKRMKPSPNLHVKPFAASYSRKQNKYGKGSQRRDSKAHKSFNAPKPAEVQKEVAPAPKFAQPKGQDVFRFGSSGEQPQWQAVGGGTVHGHDADSLPSSPLSSAPSSPGVEEVPAPHLFPPTDYVSTVECAICGQQVDKVLREEFEDQFTGGRQLSYKWQQRFCTHHRRHVGEQQWETRQLPVIDWDGLEERMLGRDAHLLAVMDGTKPSYHRRQLEERSKERSRSAIEVVTDGVKRGMLVGYYGPRGERTMTEHIVTHLSDQLRAQAKKDDLIATAGVSGGVSGFVQAVLVPELAQQLVMEDMGIGTEEEARRLIAETAELGELIHPEAEERVREVVEVE
ncbi:uncharacterized protein LTR77_003761 [Saxophila tyrrhenica]|uniref:Restriction of telomere capping protein 4 n=1 Tax=Saxophila tyrrhenica TaxID=1690608 RepID=A0AAV9PH69_9PEZI|nr:hypothetical protein LTR77_003761 [Saxophila tyrrhenica]